MILEKLKSILSSLGAISVLFTSLLRAQESSIAAPADSMRAFHLVEKGKYLAALKVLEESKESPSMISQEIATVLSFVGDDAGAIEAMKRSVPVNAIVLSDLPEDVVAMDAIETITSLASARQIVILNEAHHVAMHRAFSLRLAKKLRTLGFQYFAAEAFNPDTDALTQRGYPIRSTGFYTHEPILGDLVRQTLRLGYVPIAYECTEFPSTDSVTESIRHRETIQAKNLVERIFKSDPHAKVLIHVGYSHATENFEKPGNASEEEELGWMAALLGRSLGIDPLTIDQTTPIDWKDDAAQPKGNLANVFAERKAPFILKKADGTYLTQKDYAGKVDLQVLHPAVERKGHRPSWLEMEGERKWVEIPPSLLQQAESQATKSRWLVQAFVKSESSEAIPMDQVLIVPAQPIPSLALPEGKYRLVIQDEAGNEIGQEEIECRR